MGSLKVIVKVLVALAIVGAGTELGKRGLSDLGKIIRS